MLFANTHEFIHEARRLPPCNLRFANNISQRPDTPQNET